MLLSPAAPPNLPPQATSTQMPVLASYSSSSEEEALRYEMNPTSSAAVTTTRASPSPRHQDDDYEPCRAAEEWLTMSYSSSSQSQDASPSLTSEALEHFQQQSSPPNSPKSDTKSSLSSPGKTSLRERLQRRLLHDESSRVVLHADETWYALTKVPPPPPPPRDSVDGLCDTSASSSSSGRNGEPTSPDTSFSSTSTTTTSSGKMATSPDYRKKRQSAPLRRKPTPLRREPEGRHLEPCDPPGKVAEVVSKPLSPRRRPTPIRGRSQTRRSSPPRKVRGRAQTPRRPAATSEPLSPTKETVKEETEPKSPTQAIITTTTAPNTPPRESLETRKERQSPRKEGPTEARKGPPSPPPPPPPPPPQVSPRKTKPTTETVVKVISSLNGGDSLVRLSRQVRIGRRGKVPPKLNSIKLHIYDLLPSETIVQLGWGCDFPIGQCFNAVNDGLHALGTGAYHCGIEVNGVEYAYGANTNEGSTGVFSCIPKHSPGFEYRTSLDFGSRPLEKKAWIKLPDSSYKQVVSHVDGRDVLRKMAKEYLGPDYDLLRKNCCTFARDACLRLGVSQEEIPSWFMNLADAGAATQDAFQPIASMLSSVATEDDDDSIIDSRNEDFMESETGFEVIAKKKQDHAHKMEIVKVVEALEMERRGKRMPVGVRRTLSWTY